MIKAIIGLGNPGARFTKTRHNIGFRVLDALAQAHDASWRLVGNAEETSIQGKDGGSILLVKPQTFMNESGRVMPMLTKKGIKPDEVIVVHDELEFPFGKVAYKKGGSARGHNGLRSIIAVAGPDFYRVRCGIGRPERKEDVSDYVLRPFEEDEAAVEMMIENALDTIKNITIMEAESDGTIS